MFILLKKKAKGEKGFTLVELIVIIAVLGILAALAVPRIVGVRGDAERAIKEANEKLLINALELHFVNDGSYPTNIKDLNGKYLQDGTITGEGTKDAPYRIGNNTFIYNSTGTSYSLKMN